MLCYVRFYKYFFISFFYMYQMYNFNNNHNGEETLMPHLVWYMDYIIKSFAKKNESCERKCNGYYLFNDYSAIHLGQVTRGQLSVLRTTSWVIATYNYSHDILGIFNILLEFPSNKIVHVTYLFSTEPHITCETA